MEKEECIEMALDMQDTLSLNPFDRPPNMLMDEDLNRVTQEELEANLSTECPTNEEMTGGNKTNDMWEQLIQSVLEDSSTQEAIMIKQENTIINEENPINQINDEHITVQLPNVNSPCSEEERLLLPNEEKCYYGEQDIGQIEEVYALNKHEDSNNNSNQSSWYEDKMNNGTDNISEDCISLGYLEWTDLKCDGRGYNDNAEDKLSNIMSDHCYISQERENKDAYNELDILKRNLISHLKSKTGANNHQQKLNILVDTILDDITEEKLAKLIHYLKAEESNAKEEENVYNIEKEQREIFAKEESPPPSISPRHDGYSQENHIVTEINKEADMLNQKEKKEQIQNNASSSVRTTAKWETMSKPLEHQMFEENLKTITIKNDNNVEINSINNCNGQSLSILNKLKDFATLLKRDCNVMENDKSYESEERLLSYIREQYRQFQLLVEPYCKADVKNVEIQVQLKSSTRQKRQKLNLASKKKLLNNSGTSTDSSTASLTSSSSTSPSSSSESDEDDHNNKDNQSSEDTKSSMLNKKLKSTTTAITTKTMSVKSPLNINKIEFANTKRNTTLDYDDGISLKPYIESAIFSLDHLSNNSSLSTNESTTSSTISSYNKSQKSLTATQNIKKLLTNENEDKQQQDNYADDLFHEKKFINNLEKFATQRSLTDSNCDTLMQNSESDKENKEKRTAVTDDEENKNDKEIERLINLDALSKRTQYNGSSSKNNEKSKSKISSSKSVNNAYDITDVEFGSDDSKSEAENDIITEKQFLARCNEDIKNQLLNESSSDTEDLDENHDDDDLLHLPSDNEDDEDDGNSPLVEKFLKTFKVEDSDKELNDDDNNDEEDGENMHDSDKEEVIPEIAEPHKEMSSKDNKTEGESEVVSEEKSEQPKGNEDLSPTTSDIELLNDNLLYRKRNSKPKQLDKLLADVEKRKRINRIDEELISLSSESSDVEAVDEEESRDKLRAIKPMLRPDQLAGETIKAQKSENERISRLEKKHNMLNKVLKEHPEVDKDKDLILDYIKETKTFVKVHPDIVQFLKPHQCDGVRFMYDSCYGGADFLKKNGGSGCILAHCMGLGKTLQLIALLHTVISYKELNTTKILVLCPKSTVMNWADEIIRWLGPLRQKNVKVYTFSDTSDINEKLNILREWSLSNSSRAGCLLIGYEAFRTLVFYHSYKKRGNFNPVRLEEIRKSVNNYLLEPGADLVVCDEGHIIKNSKSAISLSVAKIVTPRRIVLTGTPIQNNLKEYYSMVNFIKPLFLGTEKEFANLYANPIRNGQHKDSGKNDIKIMKQRSFVLHKKLSKFVQRKEAELLKTFLPQKFEYVLFIPMTEVQNNLYTFILNAIANREDHHRGRGLITDYTCLRKIWTHPKVLENAWKNAVNQKSKREKELNMKAKNQSDDDQPDDIYDSQTGQMSVINDWWRHLLTERDLESIMPSNKLRTMFNILQMCEEKGEKCLIFSAFVAVLNVVEYFFKKITEKDPQILKELNVNPKSQWILGEDYYRLDGKTPKTLRHQMINVFNNELNKRARVFLISAKAGGQGINLIGANRVIILDTSWNPSNDQQNIFRVFRLGQKRNCYIYRLLAMGTMEEKVYSRSVTKQAMSFRVVDIQQIDRHYSMAELAELYTLTKPDYTNRPTPILPQDNILARLLRSFPDLVYKYHEHDSLLENKIEQELSEQEKTEAWTAYERDLQMSSEVREMPNLEDLQNNFLASKLQNYLSPFTGLDVSNTNSSNNNHNNNSNKNMSSLFNYHSFGQPFLQSMIAQNNNSTAAAATQQYLDFYNYYKSLNNSYTDLSSYTNALSNANLLAGRYSATATGGPTPVTNPLSALGDLSMLGSAALASSSNLVGSSSLGISKNLSNSFSSILPNTSIYSSAVSNMSAASNLAGATSAVGNNNAGPSPTASLLSAYEQYAQSLRAPYNNMYSYASDFGLGSSGSTILDKTKIKPNNKPTDQSNTNTSMTNKNSMPLNVPTKDTLNIFSNLTTFPMPKSKSKPNIMSNNNATNKNNSNESPSLRNQASNIADDINKEANSIMISRRNESTNDLINYRRNEAKNNERNVAENLTKSTQNVTTTASTIALNQNQSQNRHQRKTDERNELSSSVSSKSSTASSTATTTQTQIRQNSKTNNTATTAITTTATTTKSGHNAAGFIKSAFNQKSKSSISTQSGMIIGKHSKPSSQSSGSSNINLDTNRSSNIGISYTNNTKSSSNTSSLNMGIVYPQSTVKGTNANTSNSGTSEMQIIPTSSPPGTSSISKQLSDISPSISLTALKTTSVPTSSTKSLPYNVQTMQSTKLSNNTIKTYTKKLPNTTSIVGNNGNNNNNGRNRTMGATSATNNQNKLSDETHNQLNRMKIMQNNSKKTINVNQNVANFTTNLAGLKVGQNTNSITTLVSTSTASVSSVATNNVKQNTQNLSRGALTITPAKTTITSQTTMSINTVKGTTITSTNANSSSNTSANSSMNSVALAKLTAAAVLAKSSNNNKTQRISQQSTTSNNAPATLSPLSYATIKRAIAKKEVNNRTSAQQQQQQQQQQQNQLTLTSNNNSISIKPVITTTTKTTQIHHNNNNNNNSNNNSSSNNHLSKTITKQQQQQRNSPIPKLTPIPAAMLNMTNKTGVLQNRLPITITSANSAATVSATSSTSSSSLTNPINIGRSTVNIRPVDGGKSNVTGANNVYIIETSINDKKVAIGTPTKGGGGTTVTKVPLNSKRKAVESPSKDLHIEAKRFKE